MNAAYVEDGIKYNDDVNVAMAVAMPDGSITPTLRKADQTDLYQMSRDWKDLVGRAFEKKLSPDDIDRHYTISNLGMPGVSSFVSILPLNQGAIMAVAASTPTAVLQKNGMIGMVKQMTVMLTCDHRHIHGADGEVRRPRRDHRERHHVAPHVDETRGEGRAEVAAAAAAPRGGAHARAGAPRASHGGTGRGPAPARRAATEGGVVGAWDGALGRARASRNALTRAVMLRRTGDAACGGKRYVCARVHRCQTE